MGQKKGSITLECTNIFQNRCKIAEHNIQILINYLVSFVSSGLHLLIDPALELIRIPEELLQVERVFQGSTTRLSTLMQGVAAAEQLNVCKRGEHSLLILSSQKILLSAMAFSASTHNGFYM